MEWLSLVLLLATLPCILSSAIISFRETSYIGKEGGQFAVNVVKKGLARSQVNVVLQLTATSSENTDDDFIGSSVPTIFGPGTDEEVQSLVFTVRDDDLPEPDEVFDLTITVTNGDGVVGQPALAKVTILASDDAFGVFSFARIEPILIDELTIDNPVAIPVVRSRGASGTVTLTFAITSVQTGADPDLDFVSSRGTLVFLNGEIRKDLTLHVRPDELPENDEIFLVTLLEVVGGQSVDSSASGASIGNDVTTVIIRENDSPIRFSQVEYIAEEEEDTSTVVVSVIRGLFTDGQTVVGPVATPATVDYYVTSTTAEFNRDFYLSNGSLTFTPGATRINISALVFADNLPEVAETFMIHLMNPVGAVVLAEPSSTSVIISANDEPYGILNLRSIDGRPPVFRINEDSVSQFSDIVITREGGIFGSVSVEWELVRNDSLPGEGDLEPSEGILTFEDGQRQKAIVLNVIQDTTQEPAERYVFRLKPETVRGGARVGDIGSAQVVIEDSDDVYGVIQFASTSIQSVGEERRIEITLERRHGTLSDLLLNYTVTCWSPEGEKYDVINISMPASERFPARLAMYTFSVPIKTNSFLYVGSMFHVQLQSVQVHPEPVVGFFNTPRLGTPRNTTVLVTTESANGEVGFAETKPIHVDEPPPGGPPNNVNLIVSREGTSGLVTVYWNWIAEDGPGTALTTADVRPSSGFIIMSSGMSEGIIELQILGDSEPETDEVMAVNLTFVQPPSSQRINPARRMVDVVIKENDQPGGIFQFGPSMKPSYTLREDLDSLIVTVVRQGASFITSYIEYYIEPNGDVEFYGGRGVLTFLPGQVIKNTTVMPKKDGLSELADLFMLKLRPFGERNNTFGPFNSINISVPSNEEPFGVFQFNPLVASYYANESTATQNITAQVPVLRSMGRYGTVTVDWQLVDPNNTDLYPFSGTLTFGPAEGERFINFWVIPDDIPEEDEPFEIMIGNATGGASVGDPSITTLTITKNDYAIYFREPSRPLVTEPGTLTLQVVRDGPVDKACSIKYKSVDNMAADLDYLAIPETLMTFLPGEREKSFNVTILDDDIPEPNEPFYVELYEPSCALVTYYAPRAVVTILANDDANGRFHFQPTSRKSAKEGQPVQFVMLREKGRYGTVHLHYEILNITTLARVPSGQDFINNTGIVTFDDLETETMLTIIPASDGVPEYKEDFIIRLYDVSGGGPNGQRGELAGGPLNASFTVVSNDDPTGQFAFAADSMEIKVSEDYKQGDLASTSKILEIDRRMGAYETTMVAWEIFSYQIASVGTLPEMKDLLFLADEALSVPKVPNRRRPATGTMVAQFTGCNSCFMVVQPDYQSAEEDIMDGFSISAWFQTISHSEGYIMAKTSNDGSRHFYALKIQTNSSGAALEFRYSTRQNQNNQVEAKAVIKAVQDGGWHQVVVTVATPVIGFHIDGASIGESTFQGTMVDDSGVLYIGAMAPGRDFFTGYLQDIRVFSRKLEAGEIMELYETPSKNDFTRISGYVTFGEGQRKGSIIVQTIDDTEEEANEVFSVKLISAKGGASISPVDNMAVLTVQKSDNANGYFGFLGSCQPSSVTEGQTLKCAVDRQRGDSGAVEITWAIVEVTPNGPRLAYRVFVNATGQLLFPAGLRLQTLEVEVRDDPEPELAHEYEIQLMAAVAQDGPGPTETSGASLNADAKVQKITVEESDYPHGLMQFMRGPPPAPNDPMVPPETDPYEVSVSEEQGFVTLLVVRGQGLIGDVSVEWRTVDDTARSVGKTQPDYLAGVDRVTMAAGERYAYINITILDNLIPESEKKFSVVLLNGRGGAETGPGSIAIVTIQPSDQAFGVFQFSPDSLTISVPEQEGVPSNTVFLKIERLGGSIGDVNITWQVEDLASDFLQDQGVIHLQDGQTTANLDLKIRGDSLPELDESFLVQLVSVSKGSLGERAKTVSRVTIEANDDPYGVFVIAAEDRPLFVNESRSNARIRIQRQAGSGLFGMVSIFFRTLTPDESYTFLPGGVSRASLTDYNATAGSATIGPGVQSVMINLPINDDTEPEVDESVFLFLTSASLQQTSQTRQVIGSPSLGPAADTYGHVIILANDFTNGVLQLSWPNITVSEKHNGPLVYINRTAGSFGQVSIRLEVIGVSAFSPQDYTITSTEVILSSEVRSIAVPVEVVDDLVPEVAEIFVIRLLNQTTGGAVLGTLRECTVTIQKSDDPNGAFGFEMDELFTEEPEDGVEQTVAISVVRYGGSLGVVGVNWQASLKGSVDETDIYPTSGMIYFVSNEARHNITINILPDDIPEGIEKIKITLRNATNGGNIEIARDTFTLNILANDNPHGLLELASSNFVLQEHGADDQQFVTVARIGGSYGQLRVYYSAHGLDLTSEITQGGETVFDYFNEPVPGRLSPPLAGTRIDVSNQPNPRQTCAEACFLSEACLSFDFNASLPDCNWFTVADPAYLVPRTGYQYYEKRHSKASLLYGSIAEDGSDYSPVRESSIIIPDGATEGKLPVEIKADLIPELEEMFLVNLLRVELQGITPNKPQDIPTIGPLRTAYVTIASNDDANGVLRIYSNDPRALEDGQVLLVEERSKFAVELIIERKGGTIGQVSVSWAVNAVLSTATRGIDYKADGATLTFQPGETQKTITISIEDDDFPENDEYIVVQLTSVQGGATIGQQNQVTVTVMANDHVAGLLAFSQTAYLVKEGSTITVPLTRSDPAIGQVNAQWSLVAINSESPANRFSVTKGTLTFAQGIRMQEIKLQVLEDNKPKVNQEYEVLVENIKSTGIRDSGAAALDPQKGVAIITIEGGNEPHGVFSFAANSVRRRVEETSGVIQLNIDRKFGSIGAVDVFYDIKAGSGAPLSSTLQLATGGSQLLSDFMPVRAGKLKFDDGQNSAAIQVLLYDDDIAEVDEVFLVNMTGVMLLSDQMTSNIFRPKLAGTGTLAEVIIEANDGTHGELVFPPGSDVVIVTETPQNITLTIKRKRGVFGHVSAFCFAQSPPDGAIRERDYLFEPVDLEFVSGESEKTITLTILDDDEPEPSEEFEIILASPKNGLELGTPHKAVITIEASDEAGGLVSFESSEELIINEPVNEAGRLGTAEMRLRRGPGMFGVVNVPFRVTTMDGREDVTDLYPTSGYVTFSDKEGIATLTVSAVADLEPEEKESFLIELLPPDSGANLGSATRRMVSIERNDAPYGLLEIFPMSSRNSSSIDVEEDAGTVYFRVVRTRGSLERIMVDAVTRGVTAHAQSGSDLILAPVQELPCKHNTVWYSYMHHGTIYVVLLNSQRSGPLTTRTGSDGAKGPYDAQDITQSVLYRWQGSLVPVQTIETDVASAAVSFSVANTTYLFITNKGPSEKHDTHSRLYKVNKDGSLSVVQDLATQGATDAQFFTNKGQHFLLITNSMDSNGLSSVLSNIYQWGGTRRRFTNVPVQQLATRGAAAARLMRIGDVLILIIANHVDTQTRDYEINSVIYRLDTNNRFTIHQQIPTIGASSIATFIEQGEYYLVIGNQRDTTGVYQQRTVIYKWEDDTSLFTPVQELDTDDCQKVHVFHDGNGHTFLSMASGAGPSLLCRWENKKFNQTWSGPAMGDFYPITVRHDNAISVILLEGKVTHNSDPYMLVFQMSSLDMEQSDYVFRSETLIFEAGQTEVDVSAHILQDDLPEETESFVMELANPRDGAEIGQHKEVTVNILSNDNGHGVIEFAKESKEAFADEVAGKETTVQLNVIRRKGTFGRVVVRWQASGEHNGIYDITPIDGRVEFADGQSIATISIIVRDDNIPELDEITRVQLTAIIQSGTRLSGKGAVLGKDSSATLTVLANDSPHGVLAWERLSYQAIEPEGTDSAVALTVVRQQGALGHIRISYSTQRASDLDAEEQAYSGEDYVAAQNTVDMLNNITRAQVYIPILADSNPEVAESFLAVLTGVQLVGDTAGVTPSIRNTARTATITIAENDNARGIVEFRVNRNTQNRIDVFESVGMVFLEVRRTIGKFGDVQVTWQAIPLEATTEDFGPAGGTLTIPSGSEKAFINITITDDDIPEGLQTFDIKLIQVIAGGAVLGKDTTVRVGILRNDSPNGIFSFVSLQKSVHEAQTPNDPQGMVTLDVFRKGTEGVVNVVWRLGSTAAEDFLPPLTGSLTFGQGESYKTVTLRTRPDSILEGEERFTVSLVSASNNAEISPIEGDATIIILPNAGASGIISINPASRRLLMGEPSANYSGKAEVQVDRGRGAFGILRVTWQIIPRILDAFVQQQGELVFVDQQKSASILVQTKDDNTAELLQTFTLELTSATGGATINQNRRNCDITVTASDYPHGLFQFSYPPEVVVSESDGQVAVVVDRMFGSVGQVRLTYTTHPGTALSVLSSQQDFIGQSGFLLFNSNERSKTIIINIVNDDLAEGPESFFVNLTALELLQPSNNNYTKVNGLQMDMAPDLGPLKVKEVIIGKNDNAEGVVQFAAEALFVEAEEESGVAHLALTRGPGSYGDVSVLYKTSPLTATPNVDYLEQEGNVSMTSGVSRVLINITLIDDNDREFEETLQVTLLAVRGGAALGPATTSEVTIKKSDYPNGMFSFVGERNLTIPNPASSRVITLTMERTGGLLGKQTVFWRIHGPNDPNRVLQEINDVSHFNPRDGREVTQGSLVWGNNEGGPKTFLVNVKARPGWEVAKTFIVVISDIQGFPSTSGNGQASPTTGNYTLTIQKFGDPNGIVRFDGAAQRVRVFEEPNSSQGRRTLQFPIYRREGATGTIKVHWRLTGPKGQGPDFDPEEGTAVIEGDKRNGEVTFDLLADEEAELDERFSLVLTNVEGGAELDNVFTTSNFVVRFSDYPHGRLSLPPSAQRIIVSPSDLQRQIRLNITRTYGTVGRVRVSYATVYDQPRSQRIEIKGDSEGEFTQLNYAQSGILYLPTSGSVTLEDGEKYGIVLINIENSVYISPGSSFTLTLTAVQFIGIGMVMPPELVNNMKTVRIEVPPEAANSEVGFKNNILSVDESTNLVDLAVSREGTYGLVQVGWQAGFPRLDQPLGFQVGMISPETGVTALENRVNTSVTKLQLTVDRQLRPEIFAVHLPNAPIAQVPGGAKLKSGSTLARIEPYGVVRFSVDSRKMFINEPEVETIDVALTLERVYGSQESIQVRYRTSSGTAAGGLDYVSIANGAINMEPASTSATIYVQINPDDFPEENEEFFVNLTTVTRLPTDTTQILSPRLSTIHSLAVVTILRNNDPYGVLSISANVATDNNRVSEPSIVELVISRTGGSFGIVNVEVRTVGGGEPWDHEVAIISSTTSDNIGQALGNREMSRRAAQGQDYDQLSEIITLQNGETSKTVTLTILDDLQSEDDEDIFVYLIPRTDGVRVAEPAQDNGRAGYLKLMIGRNDNWNGWIGFYPANSSIVSGNEDLRLNPRLTIQRKNASYGDLTVIWKARTSQLDDTVKSEALDLTSKLVKVTDDVICPAKQIFCVFEIPLADDNIPENSTSFVVELEEVSSGAEIDQSRKFATVTLEPSDSPNGLVQFVPTSRVVYVGNDQVSAVLEVERVGYRGKLVTVRFSTLQLPGPVSRVIAGVKVYKALDGADYFTTTGTLTFRPGERTKVITISMEPLRASANPYPKMFQLALSDVTNGAGLGDHRANVTLVSDEEDMTVWKVWPYTQILSNNASIERCGDGTKISVTNTLPDVEMSKFKMCEVSVTFRLNEELLRAIEEPMSRSQMSVVKNILDYQLTRFQDIQLSKGARASLMSVFCSLLDPNRNDASRGDIYLATLMEKFAFNFVAKYPCTTCCSPSSLIPSPECPYVQFGVAKWYPENINGYTYNGRNRDTFRVADNLLAVQDIGRNAPTPRCEAVAFIEYSSSNWFVNDATRLLNHRTLTVSIKDMKSRYVSQPAVFRVHTPDGSVANKKSQCVYYDESLGSWTSGDGVCRVVNNLHLAINDYVECACNHMSHYTVITHSPNPDLIGYPVWFYISCFLCMICMAITILCHHTCVVNGMFASNLIMHMCFAVFATELCYVINSYLSPTHLLNVPGDADNYRCIVMSVFLHYFFLAQFTWMLVQAVNFWKILVLNDEHTERKYVFYFLLGWGLPVVVVAVFYVVTYCVYRYVADLPYDRVYGDVNGNEDICFITNAYAGLAGVISPTLLFLMISGIIFIQAFQVTPQWQAYDDVYKGRFNILEVRTLLLFWACILITWLWGGLHMVYSQLWMLILFCVFNIIVGLYAVIVYAILRNPCLPCFGPKKATYSLNLPHTDGHQNNVVFNSYGDSLKGSKTSLIHDHWDHHDSLNNRHNHHLQVKRSAANGNIYVIPPYDKRTISDDKDSQDFDDLIYALKNGVGYSPSEASHILDPPDGDTVDSSNSQYDLRRINIADTHL